MRLRREWIGCSCSIGWSSTIRCKRSSSSVEVFCKCCALSIGVRTRTACAEVL